MKGEFVSPSAGRARSGAHSSSSAGVPRLAHRCLLARQTQALRDEPRADPPRWVSSMRDFACVDEVMPGVDVVVHAVAMKHVPAAGANMFECTHINVEGAQSCARGQPAGPRPRRRVVERRGVSPNTTYGASKIKMTACAKTGAKC